MRKNILLVAIAGLAVTAVALTGCSGANSATHPERTDAIVKNAINNAQNVIENVIPNDKNESVKIAKSPGGSPGILFYKKISFISKKVGK